MATGNEKRRQDDFFATCSNCRTMYGCCHNTDPPIHSGRRRTIEEYLKSKGIRVKDAFVQASYVFPRVNEKGYCVFQDEKTRRCLIHSVKPETCVAGPVTFDINLQTGKIEWFLKTEKLCQLAVLLYADKERLQKHLESAKKEILVLVDKLDAEALRALLKIEEPDTFKIGEGPVGREVLKKLAMR
jgi:Fe-S-cluster containining protein